MARQLVFTSAPRGLLPGRTGLVTVARHRDLDEALVTRLERWSVYDRGRFGAGCRREMFALRHWDRSGARMYVLTRTVDAGTDYSGRANHVAHHLILERNEIGLAPNPAALALGWDGWLERWEGAPRWLEEADVVVPGALRLGPLPKTGGPVEAWVDGGRAVPGEGIYPEGGQRAWVAAVAVALDRVVGSPWEVAWTTVPQAQDGTPFTWRGVPGGEWGFRADQPERVKLVGSAQQREAEERRNRTGSLEQMEEKERTELLEVEERGHSPWLWPGLLGGAVAVGLGLVGVGLFSGGEGERWAEETRALMGAGNVGAVEARLRVVERGGELSGRGMEVAREARTWVAAERARERLVALRGARDGEGVERALRALEAEPEWQRVSPALVRARAEATDWLSARREAEAVAEAAVVRAEEAVGAGREAAMGEALLRVESLGGAEGERLRERLERLAQTEKVVKEKVVQTSAREEPVKAAVEFRAVSPANMDGSVLWSGGPLSRMLAERLWAPGELVVETGMLGGKGEVGQAEVVEVVRTGESVKLYRGMDLLVEVRRVGGEGLGWRPEGTVFGGDGAGWWLRAKGMEVRFLRPISGGEGAPMRVPITDLLVDIRGGRERVSLPGVKLLDWVPVVEGLMARLELEVLRDGRVVRLRSESARMGKAGWEGSLTVELLPGDVVERGSFVMGEGAVDRDWGWELIEFRRMR